MKKYRTVGIKPKYDFDHNPVLEGTYVAKEHVKPDGKKEFDIHIISDLQGMEWSVGGGHIDYLVEKEKLKGGEGIRLRFLGWDETKTGDKCRNFALEIEVA